MWLLCSPQQARAGQFPQKTLSHPPATRASGARSRWLGGRVCARWSCEARVVVARERERERETMGASNSRSIPESLVWPPGWLEIPEVPRSIARRAILSLSSTSTDDFLAIESAPYCIPESEWNFDAYHAAAAAAVQEDNRLNKLTYLLVPKRCNESTFWKLYFSKVLYILDCVKTHGTYPPPAPQKPTPEPLAHQTPAEAHEEEQGWCSVQ